jgi:hypothetical protein
MGTSSPTQEQTVSKVSLSVLATIAGATAIALPLCLATGSANAMQNNHGGANDTTCEVVSVGNWYCTIDGKGYYCTTPKNPDKNKDCMPAIKRKPVGPIITPQGGLKKLN